MIAKNYIRFPEALRFQCEMFSNGYHNSPRLMRLMTVIFKQVADVPSWVKTAAAAAKRLVKMWKKAQIILNFAAGWTPSTGPETPGAIQTATATGYRGPEGQTWSGRGLTPKWLRHLVELGNTREQFRLQ